MKVCATCKHYKETSRIGYPGYCQHIGVSRRMPKGWYADSAWSYVCKGELWDAKAPPSPSIWGRFKHWIKSELKEMKEGR